MAFGFISCFFFRQGPLCALDHALLCHVGPILLLSRFGLCMPFGGLGRKHSHNKACVFPLASFLWGMATLAAVAATTLCAPPGPSLSLLRGSSGLREASRSFHVAFFRNPRSYTFCVLGDLGRANCSLLALEFSWRLATAFSDLRGIVA